MPSDTFQNSWIAPTTLPERNDDALDYRHVALDPLAVRYGQLLHAGWIHSYFAGFGGDCGFDPPDPRPKPSTLSQQSGSPGNRFRAGVDGGPEKRTRG